MNHIKLNLFYLTVIILFASCAGTNKPNKADSTTKTDNTFITTKKTDSITITTTPLTESEKNDSVKLTTLVRALYKWHESKSMVHRGFKPIKNKPTDTLYTSIDLAENAEAIKELNATGLFAADFLEQYKEIAVRIDKELRNGLLRWQEGEMRPYQDNINEWCKCQDNPDNYWEKLTLKDIQFNKDEVSFKWTWGGDFSYKVKAKKEDDIWKISYMEGFDMNWYWWGSAKKTKSNKQTI